MAHTGRGSKPPTDPIQLELRDAESRRSHFGSILKHGPYVVSAVTNRIISSRRATKIGSDEKVSGEKDE